MNRAKEPSRIATQLVVTDSFACVICLEIDADVCQESDEKEFN